MRKRQQKWREADELLKIKVYNQMILALGQKLMAQSDIILINVDFHVPDKKLWMNGGTIPKSRL